MKVNQKTGLFARKNFKESLIKQWTALETPRKSCYILTCTAKEWAFWPAIFLLNFCECVYPYKKRIILILWGGAMTWIKHKVIKL